MTPPRQKGLALVSVLWGIAILSLIAAAMLTAAVTSARIERNVWNATRAGSIADASVNRAILSLMDSRAGHQPRVDGTEAATAFGRVPVRLWIQDESGKINLNLADKALLRGLFLSVGLGGDDAATLAERIAARRQPAPDAPTAAIRYRAVDDLIGIPGLSSGLFARVAPALTVYGKSGTPNPDVAPPIVLRALPNMTEQTIADLLASRDKARAQAVLNGGGAPLATADSDFLVTAQAQVGTARVVRVAVVQFTGDAAKPYLILAWR